MKTETRNTENTENTENKQSKQNKPLKTLEEARLTVIRMDKDAVVTVSGGDGGCENGNCPTFDCLAAGTQITMADGSLRCIEDIRKGDIVLTFDHEAGCFIGGKVLYAYKGEAPQASFTCHFANGAALSIVGEHALFAQECRSYVTLTGENAEQFIGRHFYSAGEKAYTQLVRVTRETEAVDFYELYTQNTLNTVANGMLNVADDVACLLNIYALDENLKADAEAVARDVQKYGLFAYDEKLGFSLEEFAAWNARYFKIAVGKGLVAWETLEKQHSEYLHQTAENAL